MERFLIIAISLVFSINFVTSYNSKSRPNLPVVSIISKYYYIIWLILDNKINFSIIYWTNIFIMFYNRPRWNIVISMVINNPFFET